MTYFIIGFETRNEFKIMPRYMARITEWIGREVIKWGESYGEGNIR